MVTMKTFKNFIVELSNKTLNSYLDKSEEKRKELLSNGKLDKLKNKIPMAHKAIDKINANIEKERINESPEALSKIESTYLKWKGLERQHLLNVLQKTSKDKPSEDISKEEIISVLLGKLFPEREIEVWKKTR